MLRNEFRAWSRQNLPASQTCRHVGAARHLVRPGDAVRLHRALFRAGRWGPVSARLAPMLPDQIVSTMLDGVPFFGGALALILGVMTVGGEFGWDTFKTLFTQRPGRGTVFAAKMVALGIALVPFIVVMFAWAESPARDRADRGRDDLVAERGDGGGDRRRLADRRPGRRSG